MVNVSSPNNNSVIFINVAECPARHRRAVVRVFNDGLRGPAAAICVPGCNQLCGFRYLASVRGRACPRGYGTAGPRARHRTGTAPDGRGGPASFIRSAAGLNGQRQPAGAWH
jgi:hypothetical protein